jgi:hypothetical protein
LTVEDKQFEGLKSGCLFLKKLNRVLVTKIQRIFGKIKSTIREVHGKTQKCCCFVHSLFCLRKQINMAGKKRVAVSTPTDEEPANKKTAAATAAAARKAARSQSAAIRTQAIKQALDDSAKKTRLRLSKAELQARLNKEAEDEYADLKNSEDECELSDDGMVDDDSTPTANTTRVTESLLQNLDDSLLGPTDCHVSEVIQDWTSLSPPSRKGRATQRLRGYLSRRSLDVNLAAVTIIQDLKYCQLNYIKKLEYAKAYVVIKERKGISRLNVDGHIMLIVLFMMHLLSKSGLGARNVFNCACDAMTTEGYFVPDVQVLSHAFMKRLLADQVMISALTRLAENWKTSVKRRSVVLIQSLRFTFTPLEALLNNAQSVIVREVGTVC